jgi:hypothetical protein
MVKLKELVRHNVTAQIITAVVTSIVSGSAIANFFISEFLKPQLDVEVIVNEKDLRKAIINVINEGRASASNFVLTLQAPQNITSYNVFSRELQCRL